MQAPTKEEVENKRFIQEPIFQEASHEEAHLSKEDPIRTEQPKEKHPLEWISKQLIEYLQS